MSTKVNKPQSQIEASHASRIPYVKEIGGPLNTQDQTQAYQRSVKSDTNQKINIGLEDLDRAIHYYFTEVIQPTVDKNGEKVKVPIMYGSPERWAAVQKDGLYRDKNGKLQTPLIMYKRDSIIKNRNIGNKLDANNPNNYSIFQKSYSKKEVYDQFSVLNNRKPTKEYHAVVIPDYVNVVYNCMLFTDYVSQMNSLIEAINYASDSYWGDKTSFTFRAMIDDFTTAVEVNQGQDRAVKTNFAVNLLGYIIPSHINADMWNGRKFYSKSSVTFTTEAVRDINEIL